MADKLRAPLWVKFLTGKLIVSQDPSAAIPWTANSPEFSDPLSTFNKNPLGRLSSPLFITLMSKDKVPSE